MMKARSAKKPALVASAVLLPNVLFIRRRVVTVTFLVALALRLRPRRLDMSVSFSGLYPGVSTGITVGPMNCQ